MDKSKNEPWQGKGISKNARLMARVGLYLISFTTCFWAIFSVYLVIEPSPKTGDFRNDILPYLFLAGSLGGLIFATFKLYRLSFAPISFIPSHPPVNPVDSGKPIEALFEQAPGSGRAISFIGSITFRPDGLEFPIFLPMKGRTSAVLPYAQITGMTVIGRYVVFGISEDENVKQNPLHNISRAVYKPKIAFYVSEADGERMYHELKRYFPSVVSEFIL